MVKNEEEMMDEQPGDVFEDVAPDAGEELERDETYVPSTGVVDLAAGEGSEADRLGGDDELPGDALPDPLADDDERSTGEIAATTPPPEPTPDPAPGLDPEPEAPAPTPDPPAPETPKPTPKPKPKPKPKAKPKVKKGDKGPDTRDYFVFLYSAEHPTVMHMQVEEGEPFLINAANWDRAMRLAYHRFAPNGGEIGVAVCPVRNFRHHLVSEKPREAPSSSIHFG